MNEQELHQTRYNLMLQYSQHQLDIRELTEASNYLLKQISNISVQIAKLPQEAEVTTDNVTKISKKK